MGAYDDLKPQVVALSQTLLAKGLLMGTGGNVSVRVPGQNALAITPSGYDYAQMRPDDICIVDWELRPIEGKLKPSIESGMHAAVYQARSDANVVIHTHQVYASACALINRPIPGLFDEQIRYLGREVAVVPYAPSGTGWLRRNITAKLRNHCTAYLLQNHGALTLGPSVERALLNAELLEKCALAHLLALYTEEKITRIPLPIREIIFSKLRTDQKKGIVTNEHGQ